jgi:NADH dehydrogenase
MTTVAVVGGTGVIGREIVAALRAGGRDVIVVSHRRAAAGPDIRYGDMLHAETLHPAISGADVVVQTANFPNYPMEQPKKGWTFQEFDERGTRRLTEVAKLCGVRRYVFIAGVGARRIPAQGQVKPYFQALYNGEEIVLQSGLEPVCIEPTLVVTPTDHGVNKLLRIAKAVPFVLPVPGGHQLHQPVWGEDVGRLVNALVEPGAPQGVFEIGGPEQMTLLEMLDRVLKVAGVRRRLVPLPLALANAAGTIAERFPGGVLTRSGADFLGENFIADNGPALQAVDLKLHRLEDVLPTYIGGRGSAAS